MTASDQSRLIAMWNTRPQPAPPAGEPDFNDEAHRIAKLYGRTRSSGPLTYNLSSAIVAFGIRAFRLGLAARPKVEDAEVADALKVLKRGSASVEMQVKAADFLERLASRNKQLANYAADCGTASATATERAEAAQADLRTKETQLAQADALRLAAAAVVKDWEGGFFKIQNYPAIENLDNLRHVSRQEAAKDTDNHRSSKEGETR